MSSGCSVCTELIALSSESPALIEFILLVYVRQHQLFPHLSPDHPPVQHLQRLSPWPKPKVKGSVFCSYCVFLWLETQLISQIITFIWDDAQWVYGPGKTSSSTHCRLSAALSKRKTSSRFEPSTVDYVVMYTVVKSKVELQTRVYIQVKNQCENTFYRFLIMQIRLSLQPLPNKTMLLYQSTLHYLNEVTKETIVKP